jgi:hypothetical protein
MGRASAALQIISIFSELRDFLPVENQNEEIKYDLKFSVINLIDCCITKINQINPREFLSVFSFLKINFYW